MTESDVIDENVLIVANGRSPQASGACQLAAVDWLLECQQGSRLLLDDAYLILNAYSKHCAWSGQPGVGDQFFLWATQNVGLLRRVALESKTGGGYARFPDDPDLSTFDDDDRLYVATAQSVDPPARVVNAVDSDYSEHGEAFARNGVLIVELCPNELKRSRAGRFRR